MLKNKDNKWYIYCVFILIIIALLYFRGCGPNVIIEKEYWEDPNFVPDTIKGETVYIERDAPKHYVKPKIVIQWKTPEKEFITIECDNDSLLKLVDSLGIELASVNKSFLTQFPNSSKLIGGTFELDTFKLDLLDISGNITTQIFPVNYNRFKYTYTNNKLGADKVKDTGKNKRKLHHSLYVNAGYDIINNMPIISSDYYIRYKKLQLDIEPRLTIESQPQLQLIGKLGILLK